ncbi:MAG: hypothetical protein HQL65_00105 [Magnetococcales bacterium]|nr:hypothetical protein [Magnetococcales bacterium]
MKLQDANGNASTIGNPAKVLWITPEDETVELRKHPRPANKLRDLLGLVHVSNSQLLALSLPKAVVQKQDHGRPTVADAGSHRRHMAHSSHRTSGTTNPWGYTANLASFAAKEINIDGLPERVVRPIPVASLPELDVQALGFCGPERGIEQGIDDDAIFAKRLCQRHGGIPQMMERIRKLLA